MAWSASNAIMIACTLSVLTPLVTYLYAVEGGHVDPFLPYIASTGDSAPESTVFTQLIVITTAFVLLVIHIRFVYVALYIRVHKIEGTYARLNLSSVCIGYLMCLGLLILSCFQESNAYYTHNVASIGLFSLGSLVYFTLQTVLSLRLKRLNNSVKCTRVRIAINALIIILTSTYLLGLALSNWKGVRTAKGHWCREGDGWHYHLLAAASDWLLLWLYVAYFLTFFKEFRMVKLTATKIEVTHLNDANVSSAAVT